MTKRLSDISSAVEYVYTHYAPEAGVSIDSRTVTQGVIFWGLPGERVNGGLFAQEALQRGAVLAVVNEEAAIEHDAVVVVPDVLAVLQGVAQRRRATMHIPVIAVTGTNGKTTTVRLLCQVLSSRYRVGVTQGNYNNALGLPLSILNMGSDVDVVVLEMGANHEGEIAALCDIAKPTHGVITSIGKAHLAGFGSEEGICRAKGELFAYVKRQGGVCFVREDDVHVAQLAQDFHVGCMGVPYSLAGYEARVWSAQGGGVGVELTFGGKKVEVHTQLVGEYNAINIVAALHIGLYFNVDLADGAEALHAYRSPDMRSRIEQRGECCVVVDCYNANPTSMRAALTSFAAMKHQGERGAILGSMHELGEMSALLHSEVLAHVRDLGLSCLYLVGEAWAALPLHSQEYYFPSVQALCDVLAEKPLQKDSLVLVKGSRSEALEQVLPLIGEVH